MKLRYFAWVRERIGKPEEEIEPPAGDRDRGRPDGLARPARRGICVRVRESESDPRGDRPHPCASRCRDRGRARDRLFPADDRGMSWRGASETADRT